MSELVPSVSLVLGSENTGFLVTGLLEEIFETFICIRCPATV
jgi:hypothetical protein